MVDLESEKGSRARIQALASEAWARGDVSGWFEAIYAEAARDPARIPWADLTPKPALMQWLAGQVVAGQRALVVGCGLGDDAELLSTLGADVTAFDVSAQAVAWAQDRFSDTRVTYTVADALNPPLDWSGAFDLIVEIFTLQTLPSEPRAVAIRALAGCLAPGGRIFVYARGRDHDDPPGIMPMPLTQDDLAGFEQAGLGRTAWHDFLDDEDTPVRRFQAVYTRHSA